MKPPDLQDDQLGKLLSVVVILLVLCIVYLVVLLPFSSSQGTSAAAIGGLGTLLTSIIVTRAVKK